MNSSQEFYRNHSLPDHVLEGLPAEYRKNYRQFRRQKEQLFARESLRELDVLTGSIPCNDAWSFSVDGDILCFDPVDPDITRSQTWLEPVLRGLMPWRKGPWRYGGISVDAEWQSGMKWDRLLSGLPDMRGKRICDVGCNNLYYSYRILDHEPTWVFAIDPFERYFFHYRLNQTLVPDNRLHFDFFGVDDLGMFPESFDMVFCMGILYHRRDPLGMLRAVRESLVSGGVLVLESLFIPDEKPVCLFPEDRYLKAPGYWFIPSPSAIAGMMRRCGFRDVEMIYASDLTPLEQRRTEWAVFESLGDFLDKDNTSLTVEGYPAPGRCAFKGIKK